MGHMQCLQKNAMTLTAVQRRLQRQGVLDRHDAEASGDAVNPQSSLSTRTNAHSQP